MKKHSTQEENVITRFFRRLGNKRALKKIVQAGGERQKLRIKYKKANGEVVTRVIRPYEIKKHNKNKKYMLYATDNKHGAKQILSLHADQILQANILSGTSYKPVWPISLSEKRARKVRRS